MKCPYCSSTEIKVNDKRDTEEDAIRRRRECLSCHKRFTTYERMEQISLTVLKRDGRREAFDGQKLRQGIEKACGKRLISQEVIEQIVEEVETALRRMEETTVPSTVIGELVMGKLKGIDGIAYLRFASVYRQFENINSFKREIEAIAKD